MWTQIFDDRGDKVHGSEDFFYNELRKSYAVASRIELLDTEFNPVDGGSLRTRCICSGSDDLANVITDGNIDVDMTRGVRRTSEFTILNPDAEFTPSTGDFDSDGPWVGKIYLNRILRAWRGLHLGHRHLYIPVGTFMVDVADVLVEQNMSLVNLTCSDLWKKLSKSYFGRDFTYGPNEFYNEIIRNVISHSAIPVTGKMGAIIDPLSDRSAADKKTNIKVKFKEGDSRGDRLKELCDAWGIDAYFDPMGVFRTEDRLAEKDKRNVWTFASIEQDGQDRNGGLVSLRRSFNDDNLYNHVIIVGTGTQKKAVRATREDHNPRSKTSIELIGDRVFLLSSDKINSQAEADRALEKAWKLRFQLSEEIEAQVLVNPGLEANDVVRFYEPDFAKLDGQYRLQRFNIPFVSSLQTVQATNIIRGTDL